MKPLVQATREAIVDKKPEEVMGELYLNAIKKGAENFWKKEGSFKAKLHKKPFNPPLDTEL